MKTIIITGASGFIGSNLTYTLSKKYKLILLLRFNKNSKKVKYIFNKNISYQHFRDNNQLFNILKKIKASCLIHCATHYVKNHKPNDITKIVSSNIEFGTLLLENLNNIGVKNFINFSTVWENYNGVKDNPNNLYSASKQAFEKIINYYKISNKKINFYNLSISDTYGENDNRRKLINTLKKNIAKKKKKKIISKKLFINLLNIKDVISGVSTLLEKKIKPGKYNVINDKNFEIFGIVSKIQKQIKHKIQIKWISSKTIKEKIYNYKTIPGWKPKNSTFNDLIDFIIKDYKT